MSAGNLFNALIALTGLVTVGTLFSAAMIWFALRISGGGEVKAATQKDRLGGGSGLGQRPSVTNQTNNQTHSLHSKPRIMSGRTAK